MPNIKHMSDQVLSGVRGYSMTRANGSTMLRGAYRTIWESNTLEAICGGEHSHLLSPQVTVNKKRRDELKKMTVRHLTGKKETCHCGIYAVVDPAKGYQLNDRCLATVVGWGAVSLNEYGWRAQYARIEKLWLGSHLCTFFDAGRDRCKNPIHYVSYVKRSDADSNSPSKINVAFRNNWENYE